MALFISLLCIVCVLILFNWWIRKNNCKNPEPPCFIGGLPLIGHAHIMYGNCIEIWTKIELLLHHSMTAGGITKVSFGPFKFYCISDPEDVSTVLNKYLDKAPVYTMTMKDWLGNGLLISDVSIWKKDRKMLSPAFTKMAIYQFMDIFNTQSRRLVNKLNSQVGRGKFDSNGYIFNNVLETTNQTILGIKNEDNYILDENYVHELDYLLDTFVERGQKLWLLLPFLYNASDLKKRQYKIINKTKKICYMAIEKRRLELQRAGDDFHNDDKVKSVLDRLLESIGSNDARSDDDIRQHLETFIFGSIDTCSSTLITLLKLIGVYTKVQEQMFKEIEDVFGGTNRDVKTDDLPKLTYIEAVIKETLRLYPIAPVNTRTAPHDVKLKNYIIPKGQSIICCLYNVNRHPSWGEDVEQFKPERWLGSKPPPANLFVGFSSGRRGCIGEQYALIMMKIILVHLIRRYEITSDDTKMVFKFNVIMKSASGHEISIKLRS